MTWLRSQYAEADVVTNWQALKKLRLLAEQERSDAGAGGAAQPRRLTAVQRIARAPLRDHSRAVGQRGRGRGRGRGRTRGEGRGNGRGQGRGHSSDQVRARTPPAYVYPHRVLLGMAAWCATWCENSACR